MQQLKESLRNVRTCCIYLESNKITDRKKGFSEICSLLNNNRVVTALNEFSSPSSNRDRHQLTWKDVFKCAELYFHKEVSRVEVMDREKGISSTSVANNREQMRSHAIYLPRLVLKKSSASGVLYIRGSDVIEFIFTLLDKSNMYLLTNFSKDAVLMLQTHILKYPQYYRAVPPDRWKELVRSLIFVYDNLGTMKGELVLHALERATHCCYQRAPRNALPTAPLRPLPTFLRRIAVDAEGNRRSTFLPLADDWLKLMLTFIYTVGCEWRDVLCRLTEDTLYAAASAWEHRNSPRQCMLLHFLNATVALHHPHHGGHSPVLSHLVLDKERWRDHLLYLHRLLLETLESSSSRATRSLTLLRSGSSGAGGSTGASGGSFGSSVTPEMVGIQHRLTVQLAARVCCCVMSEMPEMPGERTTPCHSTPSCLSVTHESGSSGPPKRRREEASLGALCAMLREDGPEMSRTVLWYDVLEIFLADHSDFWRRDRCLLLLETLVPLLQTARALHALDALLRVLCSLCSAWLRLPTATRELGPGRQLWAKVWTTSVRLIYGRQALSSSLQLIRLILTAGLEDGTDQLCRALCRESGDAVIWNEEALLTLESLILSNRLPSLLRVTDDAGDEVLRPAEECVMRALLPVTSARLIADGRTTQFCEHPELLSKVLLMLCAKSHENFSPTPQPPTTPRVPTHRSIHTAPLPPNLTDCQLALLHLNDMERLYVITALAADFPKLAPVKHSGDTEPQRHKLNSDDRVGCVEERDADTPRIGVFGPEGELTPCREGGLAGAVDLAGRKIELDDKRAREMTETLAAFVEAALEELSGSDAVPEHHARLQLGFLTLQYNVLVQTRSTKLEELMVQTVEGSSESIIKLLGLGAWPQLLPLLQSLTAVYQCPVPTTPKDTSPHCVSVLACCPPPALGQALLQLVVKRVTGLTAANGGGSVDGNSLRRQLNDTLPSTLSSTLGGSLRALTPTQRSGPTRRLDDDADASDLSMSDDDDLAAPFDDDADQTQSSALGAEWRFSDPSCSLASLSRQDQCVSAAVAFLAAYYSFLLHHEDKTDESQGSSGADDSDGYAGISHSTGGVSATAGLKVVSSRQLCAPVPLFETKLVDETHDALQEIMDRYKEMAEVYKKFSVNDVNVSENYVTLTDNALISLCLECGRLLLTVCSVAAEEFVESALQVLGILLASTAHLPPVVAATLRVTVGLVSWCGREVASFHESTVYTLKYVATRATTIGYGEEVASLLALLNARLSQVDPLEHWSTFTVGDDNSFRDIVFGLSSPYHRLRMETALNVHHLFVERTGSCSSSVDTIPVDLCHGTLVYHNAGYGLPYYDSSRGYASTSADREDDGGLPLEVFRGRVLGVTPEGGAVRALPGDHQLKKFEQLCTAAVQALAIESGGTVPEEFLADEHSNRLSCLLVALSCAAVWSPHVRGAALYALSHATHQHHVNAALVHAVLNRVSNCFHITTKEFLEKHLCHILDFWFCDKIPLSSFPSSLLGGTDYSVLAERCPSHLLYKLLLSDKDGLEPLAALVGVTKKELLTQQLPVLLARLAPAMTQSKGCPSTVEEIDRRSLAAHVSAYKLLFQEVDESSIKAALSTELSLLIIELLRLCHYPKSLYSGEVVIEPATPHYSPRKVLYTLDKFGEIFGMEQPLLVTAADLGRPLHQVMLAVQCQLSVAEDAAQKRAVLAALAALVPSLLTGLAVKDGPVEKVSYYVVPHLQEMLSQHLLTLSSVDPHFVQEMTRLMLELLKTLASHVHLGEHLHSVIPVVCARLRLLCIARLPGWQSCVVIFQYLVRSSNKTVRSIMAFLPPLFPSDGFLPSAVPSSLQILHDEHQTLMLASTRQPSRLCSEVRQFLSRDDVDSWSLQHVVMLLSANYAEHDALNVSGDSLELARSFASIVSRVEKTTDVRELAAKGLGLLKIDPLDLQELNEKREETSWKQWLDMDNPITDVTLGRVVLVIGCLVERLLSTNVSLCQASSAALSKIMEQSTQLQQLLPHLSIRVQDTLELLKPTRRASFIEPNAPLRSLHQLLSTCRWRQGVTADKWLTRLVDQLLTFGCGCSELDASLPVCRLDPSLARLLLPYIMHSTLQQGQSDVREQLSVLVNDTLKLWVGPSFDPVAAREVSSIVVSLLDCVELLWKLRPSVSYSGLSVVSAYDSNLWLQLDHHLVAAAALGAGRHHLALVQLEEHRPIEHRNRELLVQVYSELRDSAGVQACGVSVEPSYQQRSEVSQHGGQHLLALAINDGAGSISGLVSALQQVGLHTTVARLTELPEPTDKNTLEAKWECAWRLGQWEEWTKLEGSTKHRNMEESFHKNVYCALRNMNQNEFSFETSCRGSPVARLKLLPSLRRWREDSLAKLRLLSDLEVASRCIPNTSELVNRWKMPLTFTGDQSEGELVLAARATVLQQLIAKNQKLGTPTFDLTSLLNSVLVGRSAVGRALQLPGVCESSLQAAGRLQQLSELCRAKQALERVCVAMSTSQLRQAQHLLHQLLETLDYGAGREHLLLYCEALMLQGEVCLKTKSLPANKVLEQDYKTAITLLSQMSEEEGATPDIFSDRLLDKCCLQVADISDQLYREATNFLASEEVAARRNNIRRNLAAAERVVNVHKKTTDPKERKALEKAVYVHRKNAQLDSQNLEEKDHEVGEYLALALQHYLRCLGHSTSCDLPAYKIIALWFENCDSASVNELVRCEWPRVKSHKLVPLLYQLVARVSCLPSAFTKTLNAVIHEVCLRHPNHGLPVLMMMAHAHFDDVVNLIGRGDVRGRKKAQKSQEEDRVEAAKQLVERLKEAGGGVRDHICEMETVCQSYLHLANWDSWTLEEEKSCQISIPRNQPLLNLPEPALMAPLTLPVKVQPSGQYALPTLRSWHKVMNLVGGVNKPKRLTVRLSDGRTLHELLKGKDDLRQDAVLEQVFCSVNTLLHGNSVTREQRLSLRTYMVAPLSQATGLVQWCDNSQALGDCLIGNGSKKAKGLHQRYRPQDKSASECLDILKKNVSDPFKKKLKDFEEILTCFKPVMRYLFHEIASSPEQWYDLRQRYTKSLATSSAAGYILGLGDRHPHNILLDKNTAEVIQIDLGVAFDMAKILPTPETVPFRLTQNLVDGLGVCGVDGGFRSGLSATIGVMREARQLLSTVVGVLRHDPLQQWQLSPKQMALLQQIERDDKDGSRCNSAAGENSSFMCSHVNSSRSPQPDEESCCSLADRCLRRVDQKLSGVEDGAALTVSEQVTALLQQATDITNFCVMFRGWQAYV